MKENGHNDLDKLLKERLGDGRAGVPDFVWEKIEERIYPKKKRRGIFWWWIIGAGALIVSAGVWMTGSGEKNTADRYAHTKSSSQAQGQTSEDRVETAASGRSQQTGTADIGSPEHPAAERTVEPGTPSAERPAAPKSAKSPGRTDGPMRGRRPVTQRPAEVKESSPLSPNGDTFPMTAVSGIEGLAHLSGDKLKLDAMLSVDAQSAMTNLSTVEPLPAKPFRLLPGSRKICPLGVEDSGKDQLKRHRTSLIVYGGPSFYELAVFKPYFTTGKLSGLPFDASGFEAGLGGNLRLSDRLSVYALGSFNRQAASYRYHLAITEADYFGLVLNGEPVPLDHIDDEGDNSCFLAENATAAYTVATWGASLGGTYTFMRFGKWSFDADLRLSVNVASQLSVRETSVVSLPEPETERFSWLQPGAGLAVRYEVSERLSIGVAPLFSHRFQGDDSFSKKLNELVVPLTVRIGW